jgi:hypothetical protein
MTDRSVPLREDVRARKVTGARATLARRVVSVPAAAGGFAKRVRRPRVLCITGMHRSATSLTASWLQGCGLVIDNGRLLGPATGNERGHFEDLDIFSLQSAAIAAQVSESNGWRVIDPVPLSFPWRVRATAAREVGRRMVKYPTWGFKDPRSSLFLDEWRRLIPGMATLIVWRPAAEVVDSLERRSMESNDSFDVRVEPGEAYAIWRAYNTVLLDYARRHPRTTVVTSMEGLLRDDRAVFDAINGLLGDRLEYQPLTTFADESLLHHKPSAQDPIEVALASLSVDA